jgi:hypothetical protein
MTLTLSRSWIARGRGPEGSVDDFRRVVRLGRLLLQDDVTLIQVLVGLAHLRLGAAELYQHAQRSGDAETMLVASRAIGDADAIRLLYNRRMTLLNEAYGGLDQGLFGTRLVLPEHRLGKIIEAAKTDPQRPLRWEAMYLLHIASHLASRQQRAVAARQLSGLAQDGDPFVAEMARWLVDQPLDQQVLAELTH